jgi:alkylation response protein AidB-like acyl-CoA dehydrogenase
MEDAMLGLPVEEREMVLDVIRKLKKRMLTQQKILEMDETETFPEDIIRELLSPEIGLQYVFIPEEYGGMGGGARDIAAVSEELSRICLGVATAFLAIHLGADPIIIGGTEEQKQKWLGKIAEQGCIVAYAVTEPEAGSNLSNLKTRAVPVKNATGDITEWEITGNKQFISNGGYADFLTILAETPDGPTFFIVEKNTPGFKPGKPEKKHGIRCSNTNPLVLDHVRVPAENLIGGVPGEGLKQANAVFGYTRLMVAAFGLGAGCEALERAVVYAKERIQFGSPLIEKSGYTHKLLIPPWIRLEAARAYIEQSAAMIDSGESDCEVEGAIAKYFATESGNQAAELAIQAFGGYGYMKEYEIEKIKRDVRITTIYEGTSEIQQMIIGTYRWRTTIRKKGAFYEELAIKLEGIHEKQPDMGADSIARAVRTLNRLIFEFHNVKLTRHQHVMFSLADLMTDVETAAALVHKVHAFPNRESIYYKRAFLSSRILAADISARIRSAAERLLLGTDSIPGETALSVLKSMAVDPVAASSGIIRDMDALAGLL